MFGLYFNTLVVLSVPLASRIVVPFAKYVLSQVLLVNGKVSPKSNLFDVVEPSIYSDIATSFGNETDGCDSELFKMFTLINWNPPFVTVFLMYGVL